MKSKLGMAKFTEMFTGLCELFDKRYSGALLNIYYTALQKYKIDEVVGAIESAISTCKFFPKPVELIEFITGGAQQLEDMAIVEANNALAAVKRIGRYQSVCFSDPITQAVICGVFGGWVKMCADLTSDTEKWFLKDFEKTYRAYARQGISQHGKLVGLIEADNSTKGLEADQHVVLVGDKKKAAENMRIGGDRAKLIDITSGISRRVS